MNGDVNRKIWLTTAGICIADSVKEFMKEETFEFLSK